MRKLHYRRNVIELDDLLSNYYREQKALSKKKSKKATTLKGHNSVEEDDRTRMLSKVVNDCQKQVNKMFTEDDVPLGGQRIFGRQKSPPPLDLKEPVNCELLQSFKENKLDSLFDLNSEGPPMNIWSWINILSSCCQFRSVRAIFSISEAVDLLAAIIIIFLDRQLQGFSVALNECMQSVIGFFSDSEWDVCCEKIAHSVACRIPNDLNCVRIVECISGVSNRIKNLRSRVALQILVLCFNKEVTDVNGILKILMSMNLKDKNCDFLKLYVYLVLVENWLLSYHSLEERDVTLDLWYKYLRNCSSQITSTDWRSYASKLHIYYKIPSSSEGNVNSTPAGFFYSDVVPCQLGRTYVRRRRQNAAFEAVASKLGGDLGN